MSRPRPPFALTAVAAVAAAVAGGCDEGAAWVTAPVGPPADEAALTSEVALDDDLAARPSDGADSDRPTTRAVATGPRVFFLWYADGGPPPTKSYYCGTKTPPAFTCKYGGDDGVLGCEKQVQVMIDKYYADFDIVFTFEKPTSGDFYTEVVTTNGSWCGYPSAGGIAPFDCTDINGETCHAFLCGNSAKQCAHIIAQEQAHLVGLEHTTSTKDVLHASISTYSIGFEDKDNTTVQDMCKRPTQNSYRMMLDRIGAWPGGAKPDPYKGCEDMAPPTVKIDEPADGATVAADFTIKAGAEDDCAVVEVRVDANGLTARADGPGPHKWDLTGQSGDVVIKVTAVDRTKKETTQTITVHAPGAGAGSGGSGAAGNGGNGGAGNGGSAGGDPGDDGATSTGGCALAGGDPTRASSDRATCLLAAAIAIAGARTRRQRR